MKWYWRQIYFHDFKALLQNHFYKTITQTKTGMNFVLGRTFFSGGGVYAKTGIENEFSYVVEMLEYFWGSMLPGAFLDIFVV